MKVQFINGKNSFQQVGNKVPANNIQSTQSTRQPTLDEIRFSAVPKQPGHDSFKLQRVYGLLDALIEGTSIKKLEPTKMQYDNNIQKLMEDLNVKILTDKGKCRKFDINEQKFVKALIDLAQETACTRVSVKDICKENGISPTFIPPLIINMKRAGFMDIARESIKGKRIQVFDLTPKFYEYVENKLN